LFDSLEDAEFCSSVGISDMMAMVAMMATMTMMIMMTTMSTIVIVTMVGMEVMAVTVLTVATVVTVVTVAVIMGEDMVALMGFHLIILTTTGVIRSVRSVDEFNTK
jgi:hypothetical protein